MTRLPLRIAVLECDTPLDNTKAKYGGYGGVFEALLKSSAAALEQPTRLDPDRDLQISKWDVVNGQDYPRLEDIDAILITGSRHNSYDDLPWINKLVGFTQKVYAQDRVRVIGVCFGHQIVGRSLGVKVAQSDVGWEISVCDMDLTSTGKALFGKETLSLMQMHRDIVFAYPQEVTPLASSSRCAVQGMYIPHRLITVQGHPEFTAEIVSEILTMRTQSGIFTEDESKEAMERVRNQHDGIAVGAAFLKFLLAD